MSNLIFPSSLKGFDIKVSRSPVYGTQVQAAASGKELRASFQSYPRYRYTLQLNFAREAGFSVKTAYDETATLNRFIQAHLGSWDSFLFQDPLDYTVSGMGFGVGDGTTTAFYLQRVLAGQVTDSLGTWSAYSTPRTNLCPQSQTLGTGWATNVNGTGVAPVVTVNSGTAPDGTPTADRVQFNQGAGTTNSDYSLLVTPTVSGLTVGQTYTLSIWLKSNTGANQTLVMGYGSLISAFQLVTVTPTWQRFTMTFTAAASSGHTGFGLRGTATTAPMADVMAWGAQIESGSTATRYIATTTAAVTVKPIYWPASGDGFEPVTEFAPGPDLYRNDWQGNQRLYQWARTNYILYSQDPTNANWPKVGSGTGTAPVVTGAAGVAPDGTTTAARVQLSQGAGTTSSDFSILQASYSGVVSGAYAAASIWLKSNTGSNQTVYLAVSGANAPSTAMIITPNWQRFTVTTSGTSFTATSGKLYLGLRGGFTAGGSTADVLVWGAQVEQGSNTVTSYIPTTSAAVTFTDYTLSTGGLVTFAQAPVSGAVLTWTGTYYRRVRFDGDSIELERMVSGAWDGKTIKLISVK